MKNQTINFQMGGGKLAQPKSIILLFFLFFSSLGFSQNFITEFANPTLTLSPTKKEVFDKMHNQSFVESSKLVKFGDLQTMQSGGLLTMTIPFSGTTKMFSAERVEYENADNYVWYGEETLADFSQGGDYVLFTKTDGYLVGELSIGDMFVRILPVDQEYQIAIRMKPSEGEVCNVHNAEVAGQIPNNLPNNQVACRINVLIAYSSEVEAAYPIILPIARHLIEQLNTALSKSNVEHRARLVGVTKIIDVWESPTPLAALTNLSNLITNPGSFLGAERLNAKADLVFGLSNGGGAGWQFNYGLAFLPPSSLGTGAAVAKMEGVLGNRLTFTHEVGHNFGADHDDSDGTEPLPARAFAFTSPATGYTYKTVLHTVGNERRLLRYSNPDVNYADNATGDASHNNALVIQNNGCQVSQIIPAANGCIFSAVGFFEGGPFSAVNCPATKLFLAVQKNGDGDCNETLVYDFSYSLDGISFQPSCLTFDGTCEINLLPAILEQKTIFVKIVIKTTAGEPRATLFEWFTAPCPRKYKIIKSRSVENQNGETAWLNISPNPTNGRFEVSISEEWEWGKAKLVIANLEGKTLMSYDTDQVKCGDNKICVDVSSLPTGSYLISLISDNHTPITTKFIKE